MIKELSSHIVAPPSSYFLGKKKFQCNLGLIICLIFCCSAAFVFDYLGVRSIFLEESWDCTRILEALFLKCQ